jgi:hypothetical protein
MIMVFNGRFLIKMDSSPLLPTTEIKWNTLGKGEKAITRK